MFEQTAPWRPESITKNQALAFIPSNTKYQRTQKARGRGILRRMSITSEEINFLIYRYLLESGINHAQNSEFTTWKIVGFQHSSFAFSHESQIHKQDLKNVRVDAGALVTLCQKGLLYAEAEMHLQEDGTERECSRPFSALVEHECDRKPRKRNSI